MTGIGVVMMMIIAAPLFVSAVVAWVAWRAQDFDRRQELLAERDRVPMRELVGWLVGETVGSVRIGLARRFSGARRLSPEGSRVVRDGAHSLMAIGSGFGLVVTVPMVAGQGPFFVVTVCFAATLAILSLSLFIFSVSRWRSQVAAQASEREGESR